ncbi:MAG: AlpA family phage regulatory protein [Planctomycetota bacterium]
MTTTLRLSAVEPKAVQLGDDPLWDAAKVRAYLSWSERSLRRAMSCGRFPKAIRLTGRALRWRRSTIMEWISERERESGH